MTRRRDQSREPDRVTREVTPFVEVHRDPSAHHPRILRSTEAGEVVEEDGRVVYRVRNAAGPRGYDRILLDSDGPFYETLMKGEPDALTRPFEIHVEDVSTLPAGPFGAPFAGATMVVGADHVDGLTGRGATIAVRAREGVPFPRGADEAHFEIVTPDDAPSVLAVPGLGRMAFDHPAASEHLPTLLHGMGTGRRALRELRLVVNPVAYQSRGRRPPFASEVVEAVASALGVPTAQLTREIVFRERLSALGLRRHLMPDPHFLTFTFRGHRTRGLVPATTLFSLPSRGSRREVLRGTPEAEHDRLLGYLALLEDPRSRLQAFEERALFAVSIHFRPNSDVPLFPDHGGIVTIRDGAFVAIPGSESP
ncbi:MAG: hypothetical protein IV100_30070 [Myxococcales bacterium]|nr:hypothetical protein [Myxococcales bacterium]